MRSKYILEISLTEDSWKGREPLRAGKSDLSRHSTAVFLHSPKLLSGSKTVGSQMDGGPMMEADSILGMRCTLCRPGRVPSLKSSLTTIKPSALDPEVAVILAYSSIRPRMPS